jgi:hypothetical protein
MMKKSLFFGAILFASITLTSCGPSTSDFDLSEMKQKEWTFTNKNAEHSFGDGLKLKFINDSIFTLTIISDECGNKTAKGKYTIDTERKGQLTESERDGLNKSFNIPGVNGVFLYMDTKFTEFDGESDTKYISDGSLNANPAYNMFDGYHYDHKNRYQEFMLLAVDKKIVNIVIPATYTTGAPKYKLFWTTHVLE